MTLKLMGKKLGMTQLFDESGNIIACTVIEVQPNVIVQIKTREVDGYSSIQLGFDKIATKDPRTVEKRVSKPLLGHFKKAGVEPRRHLSETRMDGIEGYSVGQEIGVAEFKDTPFLDVSGRSIGKGFQGGMKLHNFSGMRATHGAGPVHRHIGSTGNRSTPGRCFPGGKRASHMGDDRITIQNVKVVQINEEENLIILKGTIPGSKNSLVTLAEAKKEGAKA